MLQNESTALSPVLSENSFSAVLLFVFIFIFPPHTPHTPFPVQLPVSSYHSWSSGNILGKAS